MLFVFNGQGVQYVRMCNHCHPMPKARKSVCCQEIDKIKDLLVGDPVSQSNTLHMEFPNACLSRVVLLIASYDHRHHYGTDDIPADENRLTLYAVNYEFLYSMIFTECSDFWHTDNYLSGDTWAYTDVLCFLPVQ